MMESTVISIFMYLKISKFYQISEQRKYDKLYIRHSLQEL